MLHHIGFKHNKLSYLKLKHNTTIETIDTIAGNAFTIHTLNKGLYSKKSSILKIIDNNVKLNTDQKHKLAANTLKNSI